jgi:hypothetical protein
MLSGEATNTNFIVFGLTQPGLEPTIYRIWGESTNHYTPDAFNIVVCGHKSKILLNHSTIQTLKVYISYFKVQVMIIIEDPTVTVK